MKNLKIIEDKIGRTIKNRRRRTVKIIIKSVKVSNVLSKWTVKKVLCYGAS